jgi:roadblock/LC7 domain-containing protein
MSKRQLIEAIVRLVYPECAWEYDNDGQLVIYTGQFQKEEVQA